MSRNDLTRDKQMSLIWISECSKDRQDSRAEQVMTSGHMVSERQDVSVTSPIFDGLL